MEIPLSWLKDYIKLELPVNQIANSLTMIGLEVDSVEERTPGFSGVVVGEVIECSPHPNAEKLSVAKVNDGTETYQVVCAASNCRQGIKTAFAPIGSTLLGDEGKKLKIKKSKLRDVESFGMLLSGEELGISEEAEGIVEFDGHLQAGVDLSALYGETVFEVSLTPNLAHCASVFGVARELSAALGTSVSLPQVQVKEGNTAMTAQVRVEESALCPRYACREIRGVNVGDSPDWLKKRLENAGFRPVNNVVDVTNYVLMELGHPLHAFDFTKIQGSEVIVRKAQSGETITTIDGKARTLSPENLLICDIQGPLAVAGVMGGLHSEVSGGTVNVLLESAYFAPTSIRKTSKQLGLQTDSSKRFERGTDPNNVLFALDRAAQLIAELAGGEVAKGVVDVHSGPFEEKKVSCRLSRTNHVLGSKLSCSEVEDVFSKLQFPYKWDGEDQFLVTVPTYRVDIHEEIDLIEEVIRFFGYDNLPRNAERHGDTRFADAPIFLFEREVRDRLVGKGLQEFLTCDLIGPESLEAIGCDVMGESAQVKVVNPTSQEQSILRTSLFPGLLQTVKYNWAHQEQDIAGFELGKVHFREEDQFTEQAMLGIILAGKVSPHHFDPKPAKIDFLDLKGIVESLLEDLGIVGVRFESQSLGCFHPSRQAAIVVGDSTLGTMGEVHPQIQRRLDTGERIYFAEIGLHTLLPLKRGEVKMEEIPIYPCSRRDWTLTLPEETPVQNLLDQIRAVPSRLLEEVVVLDIFRGSQLGADVKNVTFHFVYRNPKKTLSQETVDKEHGRIVETVTQQVINQKT